MKAYVYILQSLKDFRTYTGFTQNIGRRFAEHESGQVKATKLRRPLRLLLVESFQEIKEAKRREKWWKSGAGRKKMKVLFDNQRP